MKTPILGLLVMLLLASILLICYVIIFHKSNAERIIERYENIRKSPFDERSYRGLRLHNNLTALLISDPTTDVSGASLTVSVGSINDPIPGLAHFLEHMLFMGSEKYPQENDYDKFLKSHAGFSNAFTDEGVTNYHFQVGSEHLAPILDRFAQFFISPLFTPSSVQREVNAVDSEFKRNIPSDGHRLAQVQASLSKANHSFNHFSCGNLETLYKGPAARGISIREELLKFHSTWYSSNIMNLVVLGKENLNELEETVTSLFNEVENKKVTPKTYTYEDHPWGPKQVKRKIFVVPVAEIYKLQLIFPTPSVEKQYKTAPEDYLSNLIGQKGPNGLISTLKKRSLCTGAFAYYTQSMFAFFTVECSLTEEAMNRTEAAIDEIITLTFQYIRLVKAKGIQKTTFEEFNKIDKIEFMYKDKETPISYVVELSTSMHIYPIEDIISCRYSRDRWEPSLIEEYLNFLSPENMNVFVISKSFEDVANQTEPWYGTKYRVDAITDSLIEKWKSVEMSLELQLPPPNNFMTEDFSLYPLDGTSRKEPYMIHDSSLSQIWFKQDDTFKLPKLSIQLQILSPIASSSPANSNLLHMFVRLFKESFKEYAYPASKAGLGWSVEPSAYGIEVALFGFGEKLPVLLESLLSNLTKFHVDEKRLEVLRESYIRDIKNFETRSLARYAAAHLFNLIYEHQWTKDEFMAATDVLQSDTIEKFVPEFFSRIYIQGLIHGNCNEKQARNIISMIEAPFQTISRGALPEDLSLLRQVEIRDGSNLRYGISNKYHTHSFLYNYYQCSMESTLNNTIMQLFAQIIKEPCFNVLRTQEQLGYYVGCGILDRGGQQGLLIGVESEKHPLFLNSRIEALLESVQNLLENMTDTEFETHKKALETIKLVKPKQLDALSSRYWSEIENRLYNFERAEIEVVQLQALKRNDILDFYKKSIHKSSDKRRKLAISVVSEVTKPKIPANVTVDDIMIESIAAFKNSSKYLPIPSPYMEVRPLGSKRD